MKHKSATRISLLTKGCAHSKVWRVAGQNHLVVAVKGTFTCERDRPMRLARKMIDFHYDELVPFVEPVEVSYCGNAYVGDSDSVMFAIERNGHQVLRCQLPQPQRQTGQQGSGDAWPLRVWEPIAATDPRRAQRVTAQQAEVLRGDVPSLDETFPWDYFHTVPEQQRCESICPGDELLFDGLLSQGPAFRLQLPAIQPFAAVNDPRHAGGGLPIELRADMVKIQGDEACCSIVYRGSFLLDDEADVTVLNITAGISMGTMGVPQFVPSSGTLQPPRIVECVKKARALAEAAQKQRQQAVAQEKAAPSAAAPAFSRSVPVDTEAKNSPWAQAATVVV